MKWKKSEKHNKLSNVGQKDKKTIQLSDEIILFTKIITGNTAKRQLVARRDAGAGQRRRPKNRSRYS